MTAEHGFRIYTQPTDEQLIKRGAELVPCGCKDPRCGLTFRKWGQRRYSPQCKYTSIKERRNEAAKKTALRKAIGKPRLCRCGCGKPLPKKVMYHPDCQDKKSQASQATPSRPAHRPCNVCFDISDRRDKPKCKGRCGLPYAPEPPLSALDFIHQQSGLADAF